MVTLLSCAHRGSLLEILPWRKHVQWLVRRWSFTYILARMILRPLRLVPMPLHKLKLTRKYFTSLPRLALLGIVDQATCSLGLMPPGKARKRCPCHRRTTLILPWWISSITVGNSKCVAATIVGCLQALQTFLHDGDIFYEEKNKIALTRLEIWWFGLPGLCQLVRTPYARLT